MYRCTVLVGNMNVQYKRCETVYHSDGLHNLWFQATGLVVAICTIKSNTFYAVLKLKKHGIYPLTSTNWQPEKTARRQDQHSTTYNIVSNISCIPYPMHQQSQQSTRWKPMEAISPHEILSRFNFNIILF
jgi:hypothetical protein